MVCITSVEDFHFLPDAGELQNFPNIQVFSIFPFFFQFTGRHTDSWIQMKGNFVFNFLHCSCPTLKASAIPNGWVLAVGTLSVLCKPHWRFCQTLQRSHLLFLKVWQPAPFCSTSSLLSLLQETQEMHRVCGTSVEFIMVANSCTLRFKC